MAQWWHFRNVIWWKPIKKQKNRSFKCTVTVVQPKILMNLWRWLKEPLIKDWSCMSVEKMLQNLIAQTPVVFDTHALQHSKLAFWKTCCWRAVTQPKIFKNMPAWRPILFFWKDNSYKLFTARFDKNVYDKNILAWHRNFAFYSSKHKLLDLSLLL